METIEDIVRDMRCRNHGCPLDAEASHSTVEDILCLADRIEAAHEREVGVSKRETTTPTCKVSLHVGNKHKPMTLDEAIAHAEEAVNDTPCGREHKQLADWLKELREIKISNAAKLHEALELASRVIHGAIAADILKGDDAQTAFFACRAALSAPARNCDRFASAEEAWDAYDEWVESYRAKGETEPLNEFGWLFAEAKGETK